MAKVSWLIDLSPMVNKRVKLETKEGHIRKALLTEVRFAGLKLQGQDVEYPTEVVLDGDDPIAFTQIRYIETEAPV